MAWGGRQGTRHWRLWPTAPGADWAVLLRPCPRLTCTRRQQFTMGLPSLRHMPATSQQWPPRGALPVCSPHPPSWWWVNGEPILPRTLAFFKH